MKKIVFLMFLFFLISCSQIPQNKIPQKQVSSYESGVYEYCAPHVIPQCFDHLKQISSLNAHVVINYQQLLGSKEQILSYANEAEKDHIKIIWAFEEMYHSDNVSNIYPELSHECNCVSVDQLILYIISFVKNLSVTYGYYIGDEVDPKNYDSVKAISEQIKKLDSSHPRIFVTLSVQKLSLFADIADIILLDYYPIGTLGESVSDISVLAKQVQLIADQHHISMGFVLQAHSFIEYPNSYPDCTIEKCPYPTLSQMMQMKKDVIENSHPKLILWYSYFNLINSDNPQLHLNNLKEVLS